MSVIINIIAMVIGADIAVKKREDITGYFENFRKNQSKEKKAKILLTRRMKLLQRF